MTIFGEINEKTAEEVVNSINAGTLDTIWLYSNGGDLLAALAIYDAILGKGVKVIGTGYVASAGVIVLLGGDQRYATKNTRFMTHEVKVDTPVGVEPTAIQLAELAVFQGIYVEILKDRTKVTEESCKQLIESEHNFGLDRAIELGFVQGEWGRK